MHKIIHAVKNGIKKDLIRLLEASFVGYLIIHSIVFAPQRRTEQYSKTILGGFGH